MGVNLFKIKKWINMLRGNSVYHVNQDEGKYYSKTEVKGYYNNLTDKVLLFGKKGNGIPTTTVDTGETIYFSIAIFQYGLASYDLYLSSSKKDKSMLDKVIACANLGVENQQEDGAWVTFAYETPEYPYSAMAQGEGVSLLIRAYNETHDEKYMRSLKKAMVFMLKPFEKGGPTLYSENGVFLYECPKDPLILNGWIFSFWGLWDYCLTVPEDTDAKNVLDKTLKTMVKWLPKFDLCYWSMYEDGKRICSPFYHKLHVAQLNVMYDLTGQEAFKYYAERWDKFQHNWLYRKVAFVKKAVQKIME